MLLDVGPVITRESRARVEQLIQAGVEDGAELLLDGRGVTPEGYENGNFVGPTVLHGVDHKNRAYTEEIFGPVIYCSVNALYILSTHYTSDACTLYWTGVSDAGSGQPRGCY